MFCYCSAMSKWKPYQYSSKSSVYRITKVRKSYEFVTTLVYKHMLDEFIERKPLIQTFVKWTPVMFFHKWSMNMVVIKGSKAVLIQKLSMQCYPLSPDVDIIVAQQFLYRLAWPCGGYVGLLFFDRYVE